MSVEQLLHDTLHQADRYAPSPDLFARVKRSLEEDRLHRRRVRAVVGALAGGLAALAVYVGLLVDVVDGQVTMPWWSLEVLATTVLIVAVAVLGPLIKRFGRTYAATVFRANPPTATRFLALLDIAYYLVFAAYLLMTARFAPAAAWVTDGLGAQLEHLATRIGGMFLLMGALHSMTIVTLPVLGLVFGSGWRRGRSG